LDERSKVEADGHIEATVTDEQQSRSDWFSKPGDSVRAIMHRRCVSATDLAERLEGGIHSLRGLLDGSIAVDQRNAKTLAATLGGTPDFWLKRQANYEIALDRAVQAAAESEADEWLRRVPLPGGKQRGQFSVRRRHEELRRRLVFFNVPNLKTWEARYGHLLNGTRFRTSPTFASSDDAVLLWLRRGELEADLVSTRVWNPGNLEDRLSAIRKLSRISQPARFLPRLKEICAEAGVAVVVVRAPSGCRVSGASRLVTPDKALVLLSFRYRADDQFWFTVFHEIGHLLLHGAKTFVDDDSMPDDEREHEANEFASAWIIPENRRSEFRRLQADRDSIIRFSVSVGVPPGLTVGQMQHCQMIGHHQLNSLKRRWSWEDIEPALV
jgi:Zn-dependent peptidase ImmA (M78 family)/plasmid maintenance system antidote protein VapI